MHGGDGGTWGETPPRFDARRAAAERPHPARLPVIQEPSPAWLNRYGWLLAVSPAVLVALAIMGLDIESWPVRGAYLVVFLGLAVLDARVLRTAGYQSVTAFWALVPVPVMYLVHRTRVGRQSWLVLVLWAIVAAGAFVYGMVTADGEEAEVAESMAVGSIVERGVEDAYQSAGRGGVAVDCPEVMWGAVGEVFECAASEGGTSWTVEIVLGADYAWTWREAS